MSWPSISLPAVIILSAISSAIITIYGIVVGMAAASSSVSGRIRLSSSSRPSWLYCERCRTPTRASMAYRSSILSTAQARIASAFFMSVTTGCIRCGSDL